MADGGVRGTKRRREHDTYRRNGRRVKGGSASIPPSITAGTVHASAVFLGTSFTSIWSHWPDHETRTVASMVDTLSAVTFRSNS